MDLEKLAKWQFAGVSISSRRRGFAYFVHFVLPSPLVGRNNIGRRSSVHAVRARPLLIIKNIEPDELREEADTIPTRGVNPESLPAPGSRPALYTSVGIVVNANAPTPRARGAITFPMK